MSAEKLSPRQQMISLMYLVLLAMLAMNASKDLLNAFVLLEKGIGVTNDSFDQKNANLYAEINQAALTQSAKNLEVQKQSEIIKSLADELYLEINQHKKWLIKESGGLDEDSIPLGKDNQDLGAEYFLTAGKGEELRNKINAFKDQLLTMVDSEYPEVKKQVEELLATPPFIDPEGVEMPWENGISEHMPLAAVTANLTNIQSYVRNAETEVVSHLYNKVKDDQFKFNQLEGMVFNEKSYLLQNDSLSAKVFLGAFNTEINPTILVGEYDTTLFNQKREVQFLSDVDTIESVAGFGNYQQLATEVGNHEIKGLIKIPHPNPKMKGEFFYYPFKHQYTVGKPSATVSLTKMNVIYKGVPNPVSISVPGMSADKVRARFTNGSISKNGSNTFDANATRLGLGKIIVEADNGSGGFQKMGEMDVIVKSFPAGYAYIPGVDVNAPKVRLSQIKVGLDMGVYGKYPDDFLFQAKCNIQSYTIVFILNGENQYYKSNESKERLKRYISQLRPGDKVIIEDIKGKGPDQISRQLNSLIYTIF